MKKRKLPTLKEALKRVAAMDREMARAAKLTQRYRARLQWIAEKGKGGK